MKRLTELSLSTRWLVTLVASGIVAVALPRSLPVETRVLVVWNVAILVFLSLIVAMLTGKTPEQVRDRTRRDAHGRARVLAGVIVASLGSLIAVAYIVSDMERHQPGFRIQLNLCVAAVFAESVLNSLIVINDPL